MATEKGGRVTQSDASLTAAATRSGSMPFRRDGAVTRATFPHLPEDRTSWQERAGLTLEEALRLPALTGAALVAGAEGVERIVRHMVVADPADPLAVPGPDVPVVLGARLPPADPANCRALVERLVSMGTPGLAFRRTEGPAGGAGGGLAEADRRGFPVLALPAGVRMDEAVSEVLGAVVSKQTEALALS